MPEIQLKNRHHLRKKEVKKVLTGLSDQLGLDLSTVWGKDIEMADADEYRLIIVKNKIVGFFLVDQYFLTLRGLLNLGEHLNEIKKFVTVDKGAIKFVSNGADIMVPGIVESDDSIAEGDIVWIRDEMYYKPLAVGQAVMTAEEMKTQKSGKAVKTLHYVGDNLWNLEI
jgi:PUA domain protein